MATNATAFTHTPQAKDDVYSWTEDALLGSGPLTGNVVTLAVMVNDLGGNAKTLYSVDDGNGNTLDPDFDLLRPDVTNGVSAWETTAAGNQIRINNGRIEFTLAGSLSDLGATSVNGLAAGEQVRDEFVYAIRMANGTLSQGRVTFGITGTNDVPVIAQGPQSGAVKEDEALTTSGQFTATDADHNATQTWSVQGSSTYGAMAVDATGEWTYTLANASAAVQALAAGETHNETFTVRVTDDKGASADQTVTVTISGTNDAPVVATADVSGAVTEAVAPVGNLTDGGTIAFSDVDLADMHSVGAVTPTAGALGALTASVTSDTTGSGSGGVVSWNYSVPASAVDYLAAGQNKVESFSFNVSDGQGGSVARTVGVTITGTNDAPVVTAEDTSGAVAAQPAQAAAPAPLVFNVQQYLGFQSNDLNTLRNYATTHAASYTVQTNVIDYTDDPGGFAGELPGSYRWPAAEAQNYTGTGGFGQNNVNSHFFARITADFSVGTADTYTFRTYNDDGVFLLIDNQLIISDTDYHPEAPFNGSIALAPGNHSIELFFFENEGEASLEFSARNSTGTFGLVGANGGGLGGAIVPITDSGTISFSDADLTDVHLVSPTGTPLGGTLGTLTAVKNADTTGTGTGGQLTWTYSVSNSAIAYLAAGETKVESFTVTLNDQHGGVITRQIDVTVTGTNDAPVISSSAQSGAVTEAINNSADEINNVVHQATGTLAFSDVDLTDAHTVSVNGNATPGYRGTLSASVSNASTGDGAGAIAWTFAVADGALDDLAQGQVLTQTYSIAVNDGHGGTASRNVVVTLTGAADNSPPVAVDDNVTTNEDVPVTFSVVGNDDDVDGQTLSAVNVSAPSNPALGTLQNLGGGQFRFTPVANASGTTSFTYQANDGQVNSASPATVSITVNAVNDAPTIAYNPANIVVNGSFEQPGNWLPTMPTTGSTAITGWTVIGDSVDYIGYQMWQPADGAFSVDLDGNAPGGVQQTLVTAPGAQYTVTFAHGANASGGGNRTIEVTAPGVDNTYTLYNVSNVAWTPETFTFTATDSTSTLSFKSLTPGASGPTLDAVSVVSNTVATMGNTATTVKGLSVSDADAGSDPMLLTMGVGHGTLALASTAGLTAVDGDGSDGTIRYTGSQSAINTALQSGVTYTAGSQYSGVDSLTATINDQGNSGSGGPLSATQSVGITVAPAPHVNSPVPTQFILGDPQLDATGYSVLRGWSPNGNFVGSVYSQGFLYTDATGTFTTLTPNNNIYGNSDDTRMGVTPTAVNDRGDVTGVYGDSSVWDWGVHLDSGGTPTFMWNFQPTAISSDGYVVGNYNDWAGGVWAFTWRAGDYFTQYGAQYANHINQYLPIGGRGGYQSFVTPRAVGDGGAWITGSTNVGWPNGNQGWVYSGGHTTYLDAPGAAPGDWNSGTRTYSTNFDMSGDVAGTYIDANNVTHGFVYTNGAFETFNAPNGGVMNFNSVNAVADGGKVAGNYTGTDSRVHGFFYDDGVVISFDAPSGNINQIDNSYWGTPTNAMAIGPGNEVAGTYYGADSRSHAFVYMDGVVSSFDVPGVPTPNPKFIDPDGDIIGQGYDWTTWSSYLFMGLV